jgi:hypothetical protein
MVEEEYMQEAADREWMQQYEKPNRELDNRLDHLFDFIILSIQKKLNLVIPGQTRIVNPDLDSVGVFWIRRNPDPDPGQKSA